MTTIDKTRTQVTITDDILLVVAKFTVAVMDNNRKEMREYEFK